MQHRGLKRQRGFTLTEILIAVAVLLFLGSVATIGYQKLLDNAREAVCTTNVKALTTAVEAYALENDEMPAVLGDLEPRHVEKALAQVLEKSSGFTRLAYRLVDLDTADTAYAGFFTYETFKKFGASKKIFFCPNDKNGGVSYGINRNVKAMKWDRISDDTLLVGDCDSRVFDSEDELKRRHQNETVAVAATKNKKIKKRKLRMSSEPDLAVNVSAHHSHAVHSP